MDGRTSFVLYTEYRQYTALLNDEECGKLLKSLFDYVENGAVPDFEGSLQMAFLVIKNQLDRDNEKYESRCKRNKENGAKGGRPRKNHGLEEGQKPNGFSENPTKPKKTERFFSKPLMSNDYMSNDYMNHEDDIHTDAQKNCACAFFDDLWKLYPRKKGKNAVTKKALQEIEKIGLDKMKQAIAQYRDEITANKTPEQYVMYGSTFFNGGYIDYLDGNQPGAPPGKDDAARYGGVYL